MVSLKEHCRISELRTGKRFEELHSWIDEYQKEMGIRHREKRHSLSDIEEVTKRWGDEGVIEFLIHVIVDYKDTTNKLQCLFKKVKRQRNRFRRKYYDLLNRGFNKRAF